jgi:hypothetical protein
MSEVAPAGRRRSSNILAGTIGENRFDNRVSAAYYLKSMSNLIDSEAKLTEQIDLLDAEIAKIPKDKKKA